MDAERERSHGTQAPHLEHAITLQEVSFTYANEPILDRASCTIPAGEVTLFVGPSGAGKTSTVDLIAGLLRPQSGAVCLDAVPLETIDLNAWRKTIGYVPQEMLLLHESVFENVTLGDTALTAADVEAALRAAGAWNFVAALPDGISTPVGERGTRLSGGQRQRIAIARALLRNSEILILDEATSSLDSESEQLIQNYVNDTRGKQTIIVVAHRLSTIQSADQIVVLEQGQIIERGTHVELLGVGGRYRELYDTQYRFEQDRFINPGEDFTPEPESVDMSKNQSGRTTAL